MKKYKVIQIRAPWNTQANGNVEIGESYFCEIATVECEQLNFNAACEVYDLGNGSCWDIEYTAGKQYERNGVKFIPNSNHVGVVNGDFYIIGEPDEDIFICQSFGWGEVKTEQEAKDYLLHENSRPWPYKH